MDPRDLRAATRAEHEATEALMPLLGSGLTPERYVSTLQTLLPIVQSWEVWATAHAPEPLRPLLEPRRRAQWLVADLQSFGAEARRAPTRGVDWARVVQEGQEAQGDSGAGDFYARFLGAMYVMEGSTLGGRFLARQVEAELNLAPGQGDAYFQGHGDATGAMWRELTEKIAAVPESEATAVIAAAKRAFRAFADALQAEKFASQPVQQ